MYQKELKYNINKNGCWICISHAKDKDGYHVFTRNKKWYRIHRYMYEQKYGSINKGFFIGHKCNNPSCINPNHLFKSKIQGIVDNRKKIFGENVGSSKLTNNEVIKIFKDRITKQIELAKRYNVTPETIRRIHTGKSWKHITSSIKLIQTKEWVFKYREKKKKKASKKYRKKNRKKIRKIEGICRLKKYKNDVNFRCSKNLKWCVRNALNEHVKSGRIIISKQKGINYENIIEHLKPIPKRISNYEIHHIKPIHTFRIVNDNGSMNLREIKKAFAPENHMLVTKKEHRYIHIKLKQNKK